jgi:small subunit ribosomal protein S1
MGSPRRLRRKAEIKAEREEAERQAAEQQRIEQEAREEKLAGPPTAEAARTQLDTDDLMALADMDPAELAALMEGSVARLRMEVGDKVEGTVTRVGHDTVFVDLGGKAEGQLDRAEAPDAEVGASLEAYVVHVSEGFVTLSTRLSGQAAADHLEEALASGSPIEGLVTGRNPGGFDVRIGDVRAFCPRSMISRLPATDPDSYIGQTLEFRVIEMEDRRVVVDRRVLQEEEVAQKAEALWETLEVGQKHRGVVRNVQPFGFFVDIGGVDGLVPRREISWTSADPTTAVSVGETVEVSVLDIDRAERKLTLSARSREDDPWKQVGSRFREGSVVPGTVVKVEGFGAFVELAPGITGLAHVSKLAGGMPERGAAITVRVLSIDPEQRRIALAPAVEGEVTSAPDEPAAGVVAEVLRNGVVVQLDDGRTGWLPAAEVELEPGTVLAQRFRRGRRIEARIVREDGKRVNLSMREDPEADRQAWAARSSSQASASGFGTLGDLLGGLKLDR